MDAQTKNCPVIRLLLVIGAAWLFYGISAGIRGNYGLLVNGICSYSSIPYASVSSVMAVTQLVYGITQPAFGVLAIKKSNPFVLKAGIVLIAAGLAGIPFCRSAWPLLLFLGVLTPAGTGALSFGIIMGAISPLMEERQAAMTSGIVSAGGGLGSTIFSPVIQNLISANGLQATMFVLCAVTICLTPIAFWLSLKGNRLGLPAQEKQEDYPLKKIFSGAFRDKSYLLLLLGFFPCGFHMALIETHLFSQFVSYGFPEDTVAYAFSVYGIAMILGSLTSGFLDSKFPMKNVLGGIYLCRAFIVLLLLLLPKTIPSMYIVTPLLGFTAAAPVPPISGIIGRLFGAKKMAVFFGILLVAHQAGSSFSSWLGGVCVQAANSYAPIWIVSMGLTCAAAAASFSVKEPKLE